MIHKSHVVSVLCPFNLILRWFERVTGYINRRTWSSAAWSYTTFSIKLEKNFRDINTFSVKFGYILNTEEIFTVPLQSVNQRAYCQRKVRIALRKRQRWKYWNSVRFSAGFGCSGLRIRGGNRRKNNCSRGPGEITGTPWSIERISNPMCMS